jgi:DNA-directed RNA polymerase subunit M/transcription elongation factor TFIIS
MDLFCPNCNSLLALNRATNERECKRPMCRYIESFDTPPIISKRKQLQNHSVSVPFAHEYRFESFSTIGKIYTVIKKAQSFECDCPGYYFKKSVNILEEPENCTKNLK